MFKILEKLLSVFTTHYYKIRNHEDRFEALLLLLGTIAFIRFSYAVLMGIFTIISRRFAKNAGERYGKGSWAVITGASDGIGKGLATELARDGLNIVLIARNKDKLNKVAEEIRDSHKVETKVVVADFSESSKPGFYDQLDKELQNIDISVLVNNVGFDIISPYHEIPESQLQGLVNINISPVFLLTRKLINRLRVRKAGSAIINLASSGGLEPMPFIGAYGATKRLIDHFSRSLAIEYSGIDVISVRPGYVSTNLTYNKAEGFDTISISECARGAICDLGKSDYTYSHWKHSLQAQVICAVPKFLRDFTTKNIAIKQEMRRRAEAHAKSHQTQAQFCLMGQNKVFDKYFRLQNQQPESNIRSFFFSLVFFLMTNAIFLLQSKFLQQQGKFTDLFSFI